MSQEEHFATLMHSLCPLCTGLCQGKIWGEEAVLSNWYRNQTGSHFCGKCLAISESGKLKAEQKGRV